VPELEFKDIDAALAKLSNIGIDVTSMNAQARELVIEDQRTFEIADVALKTLRENKKLAHSALTEQEVVADRAVKFLRQERQRVENAAEEAMGILNGKMAAYSRREQERADAEQKRKQAETDAANEREAQALKDKAVKAAAELKEHRVHAIREQLKAKLITKAQAKNLLEEAGAQEEAALLQASMDAKVKIETPPQVEVKATVRGGRTFYHAACVDRLEFILEFVKRMQRGDNSMLPYISVSDQELNKRAKEVEDSNKMAALFPGIKAWDDNKF